MLSPHPFALHEALRRDIVRYQFSLINRFYRGRNVNRVTATTLLLDLSLCSCLRKRIGDNGVAAGSVAGKMTLSTSDDRDVLFAMRAAIGDWCAITRGGQFNGPELLSGLRVEGAEFSIGCCRDEDQSAAGRDRCTEVDCAGILQALGFEFIEGPERRLPCDIPSLGVDGRELPQGG